MTGDPGFERMYRVQMNTLEVLIAFLPALFIAALYWQPGIMAGIGAIYLIGRILFWRAYVSNPASRSLGFALSILPVIVLVLLALAGSLLALI
jgi:glutathione S-transferase